jgi:pyridoxal phosphate enzyme (YggS family)
MEGRIAENVARVRQRIAEAADRVGRSVDEITFVAVTKYVGVAQIRALLAAGCTELGESRCQDLGRKADALTDASIRWHMIGHLQRNKVRIALPRSVLIHSIDSLRLLEAIERTAAANELVANVLVEVNISGDESKHGFAPSEIAKLIEQAGDWPHVRIRGLMAMSGRQSDADACRRQFAQMQQLREEMRSRYDDVSILPELSMGMSRDFEIAIEEGATIVRVGSALYEDVPGLG